MLYFRPIHFTSFIFLLSIYASFPTKIFAGSAIDGAYGFRFGGTLKASQIISEEKNIPGAYLVKPPQAMRLLKEYIVATTLSKGQIYSIVGRSTFKDMITCQKKLNVLAGHLKRKHGKPKHDKRNGPIFQLGDVRIQTKCKPARGKSTVHLTLSYTSEKWFKKFTDDLILVK